MAACSVSVPIRGRTPTQGGAAPSALWRRCYRPQAHGSALGPCQLGDSSSTTGLTVPPEAAGERLDRFLARHVGSRAAAARAVAAGVLVDGELRPKSHRLEGGESLRLPVTPAADPDDERLAT